MAAAPSRLLTWHRRVKISGMTACGRTLPWRAGPPADQDAASLAERSTDGGRQTPHLGLRPEVRMTGLGGGEARPDDFADQVRRGRATR